MAATLKAGISLTKASAMDRRRFSSWKTISYQLSIRRRQQPTAKNARRFSAAAAAAKR